MVKDYNDYIDRLAEDFPDVDIKDIRLALTEGCKQFFTCVKSRNGFMANGRGVAPLVHIRERLRKVFSRRDDGVESRRCAAYRIARLMTLKGKPDSGEMYYLIDYKDYLSVMYGNNNQKVKARHTTQREVAALHKSVSDVILQVYGPNVTQERSRYVGAMWVGRDDIPQHEVVMGTGYVSFDLIGGVGSKTLINSNLFKFFNNADN